MLFSSRYFEPLAAPSELQWFVWMPQLIVMLSSFYCCFFLLVNFFTIDFLLCSRHGNTHPPSSFNPLKKCVGESDELEVTRNHHEVTSTCLYTMVKQTMARIQDLWKIINGVARVLIKIRKSKQESLDHWDLELVISNCVQGLLCWRTPLIRLHIVLLLPKLKFLFL